MISVVIPLYNKEKAIVGTLESVMAQTFTDFECVIVNDGSTDKSADVVRDVICKMENGMREKFHLVEKENGGVSSARNRGILEAKGDYVAFLDADDLWTSDYLDTIARLIQDCPNKSIYGLGYRKIHDTCNKGENPNQDCLKRGSLDCPWSGEYVYWTSATVGRREDVLEVGLFDERITHGEDIDLWWRLLLFNGGAIDPVVKAYYRLDSENRAMQRVIPLDKHIPYYMDKFMQYRQVNKEFRNYFDRQMCYRLYPYLLDKEHKRTARILARKLDYSVMKWSMHFRMVCPRIYHIYENLKAGWQKSTK